MRRATGVALALSLLATPAARAGDAIVPVALDFGESDVRQVVASADGRRLFLLEGHADATKSSDRVLVWDLQKGALDGEIPMKGPSHMALLDGKLVVACAGGGAVVIADPTSKKVLQTIALEPGPRYVSPDSPPKKALVICGQDDSEDGVWLVEIDLEDGKQMLLFKTDGLGHAACAKDHVVIQGSYHVSPGGRPYFGNLSELRKTNGKKGIISPEPARTLKGNGAEWHSSFNPFRVVNESNGFVVCEGSRTFLLSQDFARELWSTNGTLMAVHPTKPLVLVMTNRVDEHPIREWKLSGVHSASGREVFTCSIKLDHEGDGSDIRVAWPSPVLVSTSDGDELVYGVLPRFSKERAHWFHAHLPASKAGGAGPTLAEGFVPPDEVHVGEAFEFTPRMTGATAGTTFALKQAPEGMKVDPRTGKVSWKPDATAVGKHDVEVTAKTGEDEVSLLKFTIRVRGAR
jgi:hypothetical protein